MKKNIIFSILVFLSLNLFSQDFKNDYNRISFFTDVISDEHISESSKSSLKNKIDRILLSESLGTSQQDRFGLVVVPFIKTYEKTSTTPSKHFYNIDINIYAVDYKERKKLGVYSFSDLKGINSNRERSLLSSFRDFKSNSTFKMFLDEVKNKIINYYNTNCEFILSESETLYKTDKFEESMTLLSLIPRVSKNCFETAQLKIREIYIQKLERECQSLVSKSKSLIARELYNEAAMILQTILPGVSCYDEVSDLIKKIQNHWCDVNISKAISFKSSRNFEKAAEYLSLVPLSSPCGPRSIKLGEEIYTELSEIDKRDWNFKMTKYKDDLKNQRDMMDFELSKQKIISNALIESSKSLSKTKIEIRNYDFIRNR